MIEPSTSGGVKAQMGISPSCTWALGSYPSTYRKSSHQQQGQYLTSSQIWLANTIANHPDVGLQTSCESFLRTKVVSKMLVMFSAVVRTTFAHCSPSIFTEFDTRRHTSSAAICENMCPFNGYECGDIGNNIHWQQLIKSLSMYILMFIAYGFAYISRIFRRG